MASLVFPMLRVPAVRVTKLDLCGAVDTSTCSSAASTGIISIEQTAELEDRQDYFTLNADGQPCITDTAPPILKWINVTLTFCSVDPELYNMMTAEPLVLNDATVPVAIGFRTRVGSVNNSTFAFEAWTRIGGSNACSGGVQQYGYFLLPWLVEGMIGDLTLENGAANFTVTGRTQPSALWGTGPYSVRKIEATGTNLGQPAPLLAAITSTDHRHMQLTTLPPPLATVGCVDATPVLTVVDPGAGLLVNLTVPAPETLPAMVDWGDLTPLQTVPFGTPSPVTHTYAAAGTYTVTYRPLNNSAPLYSGSVVVTA